VSNFNDCEVMEKTINEIYLNTIGLGEFILSPVQMVEINEKLKINNRAI